MAPQPTTTDVPATQLTECGERLALSTEPSVHRFFQLLAIDVGDAPAVVPPDVKRVQSLIGKAVDDAAALAARLLVEVAAAPASRRTKGEPSPAVVDERFAQARAARALFPRPQLASLDLNYPHPSFLRDVDLGLVIYYCQTWHHRGYARGELLSSISLAPQEDVTLEFFTYDRHKLERERTRESARESSESASVTARASAEVVAVMQTTIGGGANATVGANVPLQEFGIPGSVDASAGGNVEASLTNTLTDTQSRMTEASQTASQSISSIRKLRIVETRETGSESRVTRKIHNENRCHTLNFDYFEILEKYDVEVAPIGYDFVVRLPLPRPHPINNDWLLCHEHILRPLMPDQIYDAGFEAAKLLRSVEHFRAAGSELIAPPPADQTPSAVRVRLEPIVEAIVQARDDLASATIDVGALLDVLHPAAMVTARKEAGQSFFRAALLLSFPDFDDRVAQLKLACEDTSSDCEQPLRLFLTDFALAMGVGVSGLAMPALVALIVVALPMALVSGVLSVALFAMLLTAGVVANDAGLVAALLMAGRELSALDRQPQLPAPGDASAPAVAPERPTLEELVDERFGLRLVSDATVERDRLVCHIKENIARYLAAIFRDRGPAAVEELLLIHPHVAPLVELRPIGLRDAEVLLPLRRDPRVMAVLVQRLNDASLPGAVIKAIQTPAVTSRVVLPTTGTVMEARLGECDACESFIRLHRDLDLGVRAEELQQAAELTRKERAEAERYLARLQASPPMLDNPTPPTPTLDVTVNIPGAPADAEAED